jgi:hypothetical protein
MWKPGPADQPAIARFDKAFDAANAGRVERTAEQVAPADADGDLAYLPPPLRKHIERPPDVSVAAAPLWPRVGGRTIQQDRNAARISHHIQERDAQPSIG